MKLNTTQLRANLYKVLDQVIETGKPVEIERKNETIKITLLKKGSKLSRLTPHPGTMVGDPENFVHMDWSKHWKYNE